MGELHTFQGLFKIGCHWNALRQRELGINICMALRNLQRYIEVPIS